MPICPLSLSLIEKIASRMIELIIQGYEALEFT